MKDIDELLKNSCEKEIKIPNQINCQIANTLNNLGKPKHLKIYIKKLCTATAYLALILFSGISVYAAFGGTINGENPFTWIGIKIPNEQYNEYKEKIGEQIYSENGTNITLNSTFYDGELAILEFDVTLSDETKKYLKIGENVITEEYKNAEPKTKISAVVDGRQLTPEEIKEMEIEQHKDENIDQIWLSLNNEETTDKNGNTNIEGPINNNRIIINNKEYYLRQNARQTVNKINDNEYKVFQTYFIPQEEYQNAETLDLTLNNIEIISNKNQLGQPQKRIHALDTYQIQIKKNEPNQKKENKNTTNTNEKISQKIEYTTTPIQTTIKITTQLNNINYDQLINPNNQNYIGTLNYELYDEPNQISFYKIESQKKITYSNGETEEWELDSPTPSKYFENAQIEITQYLICEKTENTLTIKTITENQKELNKIE